MKRFHASYLLVVAAMLASCAFDDGRPWGEATFDVQAAFDPPADRLDGDRIKTAKGYRVELDRVEVTFDAVQLEVASSGEVAAFDPANPPPGYSLCHGGHCHFEDGSLVAYEDIEVEGRAGDAIVTQALEEQAITLDADPQAIALGPCTEDCALPRGALTLVSLDVHSLQLSGVAFDADDNAYDFDLDFDLEARLSAVVDGQIGKGEPGAVDVNVTFMLPPHVLDAIEFDQPGDVTAAAVREAIERDDALVVTLSQHDLE